MANHLYFTEESKSTQTLSKQMKNKVLQTRCFFIALLVLIGIMPLAGYGQNELTVYDGGNNNVLVPYSYYYRNQWQKCEFVIPASALASMEATDQTPKLISNLTFYHNLYGYYTEWTTFKVFLEEVDFDDFEGQSSFHGYNEATIVYEGRLDYTEYKTKVTFNENFVYHGGNLLIGLYTTKAQIYAGSSSTAFYGTVVSNAAMEGYADDPDNISANIINFIPKTTFVYYDEDYCFAPKNLYYDENTLTSSSVELDWTPVGHETVWNVYYSDYEGNEFAIEGVTEHPYTLSDLEPATYYSVTVSADCGDENTSDWSYSTEFMTNCPTYASVPLYEGFENEYPVCWSIYGSGYYNNSLYTTNYYESYDGYNSLMFNLEYVNSAYYAILPAIANLDECQISFYAMVPEYGYPTGTFSVGIMTDPTDPSTFVTIKTFESTYEWMEYKAYFDHYTGNGTHIAIKMDASYHGILLVDEVSVEPIEANTCFEIDAVVPTYVGMNSAVVSWTAHGNESSWEMQYKTEDEEWPEESTLVATSLQTLENLEPNVKYDIRVRAYCSAESQSDWTQTSFTTPFCDPENQCDIHYVLRTSESWGWEGNSIDVYNEDDVLVGSLTVENGSMQEGDLYLCDGATYNFVLNISYSWAVEYFSCVIYGPDGNPIEGLNYSEGTMPTGDDGEQIILLSGFEMVCPDCRRPKNLTADNITSSSAVLTWEAGGAETDWVLQYSADQSTWQDVQVNTNPTYTLQNLDGNKVYYVRVLAHCGGNDYSIPSNVCSFRTDCPEYQSIPYSEDFNYCEPYDPYGGGEWKAGRMVSDRLPSCWNSLNESMYYENSSSPYIYYDGGYETESNSLKFYVYNNGEEETIDQYAILPAMQNIGGLQMKLKAVAGESSELAPFSVGVMSDPTDADSFVEIMSFEATGAWDSFVVYFDQYEGQDGNIAIKVATPDEWQSYILYVDDLEISELPTCFVPVTIAYDEEAITENSVMIGWVPYGDETEWEIQYTTDQINWTSILVTTQDVEAYDEFKVYTMEGLLANNQYYVHVRANCGGGDYSDYSNMIHFRTSCGEYQPLPYYEDFESCSWEDPLPQCWASINTTPTSGYPSYTSEPIYISDDQSNRGSLYFYCRTASLDLAQYAILPYMQDIQSLKMSFIAKGEANNYLNYYSSAFQVGVMTDPGDYTTFQTIMSVANFNSATRYFTVYFDEYQGEGGYIAIKVPAETGAYKYLKVDNILISNYVNTDIEAYTADDNGWHLIASPVVGSISPLKVDNMTNESFDLYVFDQSAENGEWRNYKTVENGFMLENGRGYLYANDNDVTLSFAGAMQSEVSVEVPLTYVAGNPSLNWNLVGNPFNCNATIVGNPDYYRINGNMLEASNGVVETCEGVFIQATAERQSVTFERTDVVTAEPGIKGALNLGLYKGGMSRPVDLTRIRFNEGDNMGKLNMLSDPNKLYIPLDGNDYATVHADANGELPLNFKVAENGSFTITAELVEVELDYLHLIDSFTGQEIDLLETPSYTFEAKTSDNPSRFKVVFAKGGSTPRE